jgi:hypothetical protein
MSSTSAIATGGGPELDDEEDDEPPALLLLVLLDEDELDELDEDELDDEGPELLDDEEPGARGATGCQRCQSLGGCAGSDAAAHHSSTWTRTASGDGLKTRT